MVTLKFAKRKSLLCKFQVVKAAQGRIPVFLDGGVRRGTDVFKALALGAAGVFVSFHCITLIFFSLLLM